MFAEKHLLSPDLVQHIHDRIRFSRESVEQAGGETLQDAGRESRTRHLDYEQSNYKIQTPSNQMLERGGPQEQSFGGSERFERYEYLQSGEERLFTDKREDVARKLDLQAPTKKEVIRDKDFMIYDRSGEKEDGVELFPQAKKQPQPQAKRLASGNYQTKEVRPASSIRESVSNSQRKPRKAIEVIQQLDKQNIIRGSQSMMKLKPNPVRSFQPHSTTPITIPPSQPNHVPAPVPASTYSSRLGEYSKPSHVKILRRQQIQSLNHSLRKSVSKQQVGRIGREVTKRLYNQADMKKNYLKLIKEKARREKERVQDAELTHRPEINRISKVIAEGRKKGETPVQVYLMEEGRKVQAKRAQQWGRKALQQIENCSFQPQLNLISQKLASDRQGIQSRMRLRESDRRNACAQKQHRPELNEITRQLMRDKGGFEERQRQYLQQRNSRLVELVREKMLKEKVDVSTGRELFRPRINDVGVRESQGGNIGAYLYGLGRSREEGRVSVGGVPRISESSSAMVEEMYRRRVAWLFGELDSDQDGVISAQRISIDGVELEVLEIIKPILFQMEEMREELTLEEFRGAVEILHKKLGVGERSVLYGYRQRR